MDKTIYCPAYRRLVARLVRARRAKGLRQIDVAASLGVSRHWVGKIEHCDLRLDMLQFVRIC